MMSPSPDSPASSLSEFSLISHPRSPYNAAVLVEHGDGSDSDNERIIFSPRPSGYDSDDDFILIGSPRTAAPKHGLGLALDVDPAPSRIPNDEQLVTPTRPTVTVAPANGPSLPTPASSGPSNRSQSDVARGIDVREPSPAPTASSGTSRSARRRRARQAEKSKMSAASYPSPSPSPSHTSKAVSTVSKNGAAAKGTRNASVTQRLFEPTTGLDKLTAGREGFGSRGVIIEDDDDDASLYQVAANFVSSYLANGSQSGSPRLPLLQALIIELGICSPTSPLPASVKAAKALLRAHAHINVRDYIAERGNGVDALRKVMFPSRSTLIKDLRKRRVPIQWIKEHGMSMFLVSF